MKKAVLFLALCAGVVFSLQAQTDDTKSNSNYREVTVDDALFVVVEKMPEFPGGDEALYKYIANNIQYPEQAKKEKITGRVFVSFVVEKDGSISSAKVMRGIGGGCDEEVLRMVRNMPLWKPGTQRGKPVRVQYNLPVLFQL